LIDEEYEIVREHPNIGERILEPIKAYAEIIPMVRQHHEKFNGKGYPEGIAGKAITLGENQNPFHFFFHAAGNMWVI
jgi:HD-GYP domain-containing protein (c-di-GMP phosphodiesterase class II)